MKINTLSKNEILSYFPSRSDDTNKGDYGVNTIFASCDDFIGASKIALLGSISMRFGVGYTALAVTPSVAKSIGSNVYECIIYLQDEIDGHYKYNEEILQRIMRKSSSIAIGMGMKNNDDTRKAVLKLLDSYSGKLLLDADALNSIKEEDLLKERSCSLVLTPHFKELSRIINKPIDYIKANKEILVTELSRKWNCVLLIKDSESLISDGNTIYKTVDSSPSLAKAGSGDFLSGAISALMIRLDPLMAAAIASQIIASCAKAFSEKYNDNVMLTRDLSFEIAEYFKE